MILSLLHAIEEAIKARPESVEFVLFDSDRRDRRINELKRLCREGGVSMRYGQRQALERLAGPLHQGAVERVPVVRVKNLRRFVDLIKNEGFSVIGLDASGTDLYKLDLTGDLALVFGG